MLFVVVQIFLKSAGFVCPGGHRVACDARGGTKRVRHTHVVIGFRVLHRALLRQNVFFNRIEHAIEGVLKKNTMGDIG